MAARTALRDNAGEFVYCVLRALHAISQASSNAGLDPHEQMDCVVITADHSAEVRDAVAAAGCTLLHKPLKPLALKSVMARLLAR